MKRQSPLVYLALLLLTCEVAWCSEAADAENVPATTSAVGQSASNESSRRVQQLPSQASATPAIVAPERERSTMVPTASPDVPGNSLELLVRRALLALMLAGALAVVLFLTIGKKQVRPQSGGSDSLELVSTLTLAPRCCISLVRAQGQTVLVARDASGVKEMVLLQNGFESFLDEDVDAATQSLTHVQPH